MNRSRVRQTSGSEENGDLRNDRVDLELELAKVSVSVWTDAQA